MERAVAIKRLGKLLGKSLGYRINDKAPTQEERAAAREALKPALEESIKLRDKRDERRQAILEADAEYSILAMTSSDDYTRLKWDFKEHRDGETARFRVAGLEAYVQACDGDASWWQIKDVRTRKIIAKGGDDGFDPDHFWFCLVAAETALRAEVNRRKANLVK